MTKICYRGSFMEYKLENMSLIATGGQAEIYEINENKVLRILRSPADEGLLKTEHEIMRALKKAGLDVPESYEYVIVNGRPALVVERIKGASMMEAMLKSPLKPVSFIKLLAKLHCGILKVKAAEDLTDIKKRAKLLTEKSAVLSDSEKHFVYSVIAQVPDGESLCHGDFHPGNILISGDRYYTIDWFGATKGAPVSDAAHTYLLLKSLPKVPGSSGIQNVLIKLTAKVMAEQYLKAIRKELGFPEEEFSRWLVIRAAERSYYGFEGEKEARALFVEKCSENLDDIKSWKEYI